MEERVLRSRVNWIVGLVLATAFVGTIVYSVVQDSDDGAGSNRDEALVFEDIGEAIDPGVAYPLEAPLDPTTLPDVTLTVHTDGCGVIRSEVPAGTDLTWVVKDVDGFQVLGRSAEGETRYRYFQPGAYTVVVESSGVEVSNTVQISC